LGLHSKSFATMLMSGVDLDSYIIY